LQENSAIFCKLFERCVKKWRNNKKCRCSSEKSGNSGHFCGNRSARLRGAFVGGVLLTRLVGYAAGGFAGGLTGGLAFAAATAEAAFRQVSGGQRLNSLHGNRNPLSLKSEL
jgi:hypothetical protein